MLKMSQKALAPLEKHLALTQISKDLYRNKDPHRAPAFGARGVFGGTFIAQSLQAAISSIDQGYKPYSLHCNFLIGGDPHASSEYKVTRTRDGKNYATRQVEVYQKSKVIFICMISFQAKILKGSSANLGPQLSHQPIAPNLSSTPPPEEMQDSQVGLAEWMKLKHVKPYVRNMEEVISDSDMDPCDWRLPDDYFHGEMATATERGIPIENRSIKFWFRAKPQIQNESFHNVALAYCSDMYFLSSTNRLQFRNFGSLAFSVSLDHTIYFHEDFRADDWLLYVVKNPRTGGNRSLVTGEIFNRDGLLVATTVQEGLAIIDDKKPFGILAKNRSTKL